MDPGMLSNLQMLQANGGAHGKGIFGFLNELPPSYLEAIAPLSETTFERFMRSIFPQMQQAFILNFPGGTLWRIIASILERLHHKNEQGFFEFVSTNQNAVSAPEGGVSQGSGAPGLGAAD